MAVIGALSYTLSVPEISRGIEFYKNAGFIASESDDRVEFRCNKRDEPAIILLGGADKKKLHHITLCATNLDAIASRVEANSGNLVDIPTGYESEGGLWVMDPHGMLIHLVEKDKPSSKSSTIDRFMINEPQCLVRKNRPAMKPRSQYPAVKPLKLGHVLVFTPDVLKSVDFMVGALDMRLADRAQDVIAFTCTKRDSDHHVVAFAKSPGVGFHHSSFEVNDPDEVGRGGVDLVSKTKLGDWGFGRHTIGSNFFHYIQDPWGSWFEYYSDMDHIDDHSKWVSKNYEMQDSLASWGPQVPVDFVHNYEVDDTQTFGE